jgi:hypothetical protein
LFLVGATLAGGLSLVELNRVLRPGGFFIWSATPVYSSTDEDKKIWTGSYCFGTFTLWIVDFHIQ